MINDLPGWVWAIIGLFASSGYLGIGKAVCDIGEGYWGPYQREDPVDRFLLVFFITLIWPFLANATLCFMATKNLVVHGPVVFRGIAYYCGIFFILSLLQQKDLS